LKTFFKHMGQQYINEVLGWPLFWPHDQLTHPLGQNRIAVVEGFTLESLAEACVKCRETILDDLIGRQVAFQRDRGNRDDGKGVGGELDYSNNTDAGHADKEALSLLGAAKSVDITTSNNNDDVSPPPPTSDTDARLRSILNNKQTSVLKDLNISDAPSDNYGLPADVVDDLRAIARAAMDGGEDVALLLKMF
jgi:hypothetical protein